MAIAVQKYMKNMAKSVAYSASDVLSTKFEYAKDFKNENQEVFKEAYSSIKDYRSTFTRVKKTITNNKVMDAARVGFDSMLYSVTTGDFYAKNKEAEVIEKYGGSLMEGMDIDDDDFNWDNEDLSTGDKIVATAIKKNSKIGTALTVEAIAQTGKAQMDVSKENAMLLYTQNERLLNKLDGGFTNVMDFLKHNGEQTAKVQNQMNENLNKFMTNMDNNVAKLTKQMDELLEMQRNIYKPTKEESKKKVGYDDIISRNGVINIKEYAKQVKKQGFETLNSMSGNMLSMIFGDTMGEGSNLLAQIASTPFRSVMTGVANKALGKNFDNAAGQLNTTLEGLIPSLMAKLNSAGKKDDSGIMGFLGKIFGIKSGTKESVNTSTYTKGAIPFDGITKRAITDVIPYYLRKMTSILTGGEEMVYDYQTGRWTSMKAVKSNHSKTMSSAIDSTSSHLTGIIEKGMGGQRLSDSFESKSDYKRYQDAMRSYSQKLHDAEGDFGSIRMSDLRGVEAEIHKALMKAQQLNFDSKNGPLDRRLLDNNGKRIDSGRGRSTISSMASTVRQHKLAQNSAIKSINEGDSILRTIDAENLAGVDSNKYKGKGFVNQHGDFSQRAIQEMPIAQALIRAKDSYGVTMYEYLRDMGSSLRLIKANSIHLSNLTTTNKSRNNKSKDKNKKWRELLNSGSVDYNNKEDKNYAAEYYKNLETEADDKEKNSWNKRIQSLKDRAKAKGESYTTVQGTDFSSSDTEVGLARIMAEADMKTTSKAVLKNNKERKQAEDDRWKKMAGIVGKERAQKLREASEKYDKEDSLGKNMSKVKDQGFGASLMMFSKVLGEKVGKPGDAAADTILKVDHWLQNLIYGEDLKEDERKKSLFERMRDEFKKGFDWIKDKVSKSFDWLKEKMEPVFEPFKKIGETLFGKKNDDGIYEKGLLSPFIGGVQKGLRKNAKDVAEFTKREAAKKLAALKNNEEPESANTYNPVTAEQRRHESYNQKLTNAQIQDKKQEILKRKEKYEENKALKARGLNPVSEGPKQEKYWRMMRQIRDNDSDIDKLKNEKKQIENELKLDVNPVIDTYTHYKGQKVPEELINKRDNLKARLIEIDKEIAQKESIKNSVIKSLSKNGEKYRNMAAGGVNKTGSPFKSVLSAGELHNGNVVPSTGIYNINPGDTVVNPAPPSVRSKQARNEKRFLKNIRANAEANDKLSPVTEATPEPSAADSNKQIAELMTNRDWTELEDDKQRAEFLGNVASRGLIGGGIGLLAGGPILGAAIGAASSLTKSTSSFANFLFGESTGKVDEDGNIIRSDNGLISQELMDAVPSIKKFGLAGLVGGLLTPIGPLGGVLAGSAIGFAKNSEMFQGSLFGEGGVFSDENIDKLKKGGKNIAAGAILGAFTGPFGLVGNALLGGTIGYATSTDKFKDMLLGEREDPNDPESKRKEGTGVIGHIKQGIAPLKDFGRTVVESMTDAIFGKKDGDDKRQGGLFGLVRDSVVTPLAEGTKSIVKELKNKAVDIGFMAKKTWKNIQTWMSGGDAFGLVGHYGSKLAKGAIGVGKGVATAALSPLALASKGVKGIGNSLKKGRIRKGRADDLTANERLQTRKDLKMGDWDNYHEFDTKLADMNQDSIQSLMDRLSFSTDGANAAHKEELNLNDSTRRSMKEYLNVPAARKVNNYLKKDDYAEAERYVKTAESISPENREQLLKIIDKYKKEKGSIQDRFKRASDAGKLSSKELKDSIGLDVDLNDESAVDSVKRMLNREKIHIEAGETDEDREAKKKRDFWLNNENGVLNPINDNITTIVSTIDKIYNEIKLGNEYDKLSDEEKSKYESKDDYIEKKTAPIPSKLDGEGTDVDGKPKSNKKGKSLFKKLDDIEDKKYAKTLREIADRGVKIFNGMIEKELSDDINTKLRADIDLYEAAYDFEQKYNEGDVLARIITINRFNNTYNFRVQYTAKGNDIAMCEKQDGDFEIARENFVSDYMKFYMPKYGLLDKIPGLGFGDIIKKSVKASGLILLASVIPGGFWALGAIKLGSMINKKFDITGKVKNAKRRAKDTIKHNLGSHDVDWGSKAQGKKDKKYNKKAMKAFEKALKENNEDMDLINDISMEKFKSKYNDLDERQQDKVQIEFMDRYRESKHSSQLSGHGLIGNIKKTAGTLKSGVKNKIAGGIEKVTAIKEKAQQEETLLGKFFDKLDARKVKKEKDKEEGKDSKLARIMKWIFVGGIAAPLIVGFVKEKLMPAIHDKIQPWLKKGAEKLIGVRDPQTGEYKGGLVSGIVNPIRGFFKDKFQTVHDWFHNTGKFTDDNSGFKGLIGNFKNIFAYGVELWKSGANTIISDFLPGMVEGLVSNLLPILKSVGEGIIGGIASWFKKKDGDGDQAMEHVNASMMIQPTSQQQSESGNSIQFNNTVGGTFSIGGAPAYNPSKLNYNFISGSQQLPTSLKENEDGTKTLSNEYGKEVTSEMINDNEMVSAGVNKDGDEIFYNRSDKNRTQPYSKGDTGQYVRMDTQAGVVFEKFQNNKSFDEMLERNDNMDAGVTNSYTGTTPGLDGAVHGAKVLALAGSNKSHAKGLSLALKAGGNVIKGGSRAIGGLINLIPGVKMTGASKILNKVSDGIGNFGIKHADGFSNGIFSGGQKLLDKGIKNSQFLSNINDLGIKIGGSNTEKYELMERQFNKLLAEGNEEAAEGVMNKMIKLEDKIKKPKFVDKIKNNVANKIDDVADAAKNSKAGKFISAQQSKVASKMDDIAMAAKNSKVGQTLSKGKGMIDDAAKAVKNSKAVKKVTDTVGKVKGAADDIVKTVKGLFSKAKNSIVDWFKKLFKSGPFSKALKEAGQEATEEAVEKMAKESGEKLVKECAGAGAEKVAAAAGKAAVNSASTSTGIGVVINIAIAIADFAIGLDDCRNILGIVDDKVPITWRLFAGIANALQDIPYVGIIFGVIGAKNIVGFIIDILGPIIMPKATEELREKREQAQDTLKEYNRENNVNLTLEEYNNKFNATVTSTVKGAMADAGSFLSGRDATVSQSIETRRHVTDANDTVTKIREKLEDIASHMWEKEGTKFKNFGLAKESYSKLCAEVIDKIVILLNGLDESSLEAVKSSAGKMRMSFAENTGNAVLKGITFGLVDTDPFVDGWKDGYKGLEYLGLDEDKFENTDVVKCIGGIASIFVKSCGGAGLKWSIIDIVISVFGNGLSVDNKMDDTISDIIDDSEGRLSDVNNTFNSSVDAASSSGELSLDSGSSTTPSEDIVTNAYANNKLTKINKINDKSNNSITSGKLGKRNLLSKIIDNGVDFAKDNPVTNIVKKVVGKELDLISKNPFIQNISERLSPLVDEVKKGPEWLSKIFGGVGDIGKHLIDILKNKEVATNAEANDKLTPFGEGNPISSIAGFFANGINKSVSKVTSGFDNIEELFNSLNGKNKSSNDAIDNLKLLPTDKRYWKIELDKKNPFVSGLYNFMESVSRVVKAPFALSAASLGSGLSIIGDSASDATQNTSSGSATSTSDSTGSSSSNGKSKDGILSKISTKFKNGGKKVLSGLKSLFGKGVDDRDIDDSTGFGDDPYHIYQRDYKGSYRTSGDTENQTVSDSGCGPAAAASLLRMYGKKGDMNNAVNYALSNKYKEVNGGTYPQYFNDYLSKNGISTNPSADNKDVVNSLANNKPVILMGRDAKNSGQTPYGAKYSHYVVARGLDKNGNVIVEDSEDKRGGTRYSLAETLRNSSVKITTGNGKYGRGEGSTVLDRYNSGVNAITTSAVTSIIGNAANIVNSVIGSNGGNSSSTSSQQVSAGTNGVEGTLTKDSDVKTSCGYTAEQLLAAIHSIHPGCSAEQFPEPAIALENSKGVNALFSIAVAIQEHDWDGPIGVNTSGGNYGNWNPFNNQGTPNSSNGRWRDYNSLNEAFEGFGNLIMGSTYYGAGLTTPAKIGNRYCPPDAAENSGYSPWGEAVCGVASLISSKISGSGRGKGTLDKLIKPSFSSKFMHNVNNTISYYSANILANAGYDVSSVTSNTNNTTNNGGTANVNIDSSTVIICGDSITYGLSSTSLGSRAMGLSSGTTDKNQTTNAGSYESIFKSKSDIIADASDAIFFWGMNEVNTSMSPDDYFVRYQDSIDTILGYGGRTTSDTNVYILPVIWVPENSGYGGSYNASKVEKFNNEYIKPFAQKKGYTFVDIYEDSKDVPHGSGDVHPSDYQKLYEIIKSNMGGGTGTGYGRGIVDRLKGLGKEESENVTNSIHNSVSKFSGHGRGRVGRGVESEDDIITGQGKKSHKYGHGVSRNYGRGIWGRDGEEDETTTETTTDTDETLTDSETTDTSTDTTSTSNSSGDATGLIGLLGKYSKAMTKGIFGDFYDALYGSEADEGSVGSSSGSVGSGDAAKMLGKSLTLSRSNGKGTKTMTLTITEDEVDLYSMLTGECGLNAAVACGVLGNWEEECGNGRIRSVACKGQVTYGGGLMQWTPPSKHVTWANSNGFSSDPWSWEANKAHAKAEIDSGAGTWSNCTNASPPLSEHGFKAAGSMEEFKNLTSAEDAAVNYERAFEVSFNWNGRTSENVTLADNAYYDNARALAGKILYEMIVNGKCDEGGSGRGKSEKFTFSPRESKLSDVALKRRKKSKISKGYGRGGVWGRDGEEETTAETSTNTDETLTNSETTYTSTDTTPTSTSSPSNGGVATSLISKLGKYAKAGIKGVFGNFYDALYGSEVEEGGVDSSSSASYDGTNVIYAAAMVFEALYKADPTLRYDCNGGTYHTLTCRDGTVLEHERPDCSGMMSAVIHYMGYYTARWSTEKSYTDSYHGEGFGTGNWKNATSNTCIYDKDGNLSTDWEVVKFDPNDSKPGDIRFTDGHTDMYVMDSSGGNRFGFNAGSGDCGGSIGNGMYNSYCLSQYYFDNGNQLPGTDKCTSNTRGNPGAWTIQDKDCINVLRYKGSGNGKYGRGSSRNSKSDLSKLNNIPVATAYYTDKRLSKINAQAIANEQALEFYNGGSGRGNSGRGVLKSLDSVQSWTDSRTGTIRNTKSNNGNSNSVSMNYGSSSTSSGTNNNTSIDLNQLIGLINVIANNSDKIDSVLQLLGAIAVNTENTTTAVSNKNSNNTSSKNGLSALRSALDNNGSGVDIARAVYEIAKS